MSATLAAALLAGMLLLTAPAPSTAQNNYEFWPNCNQFPANEAIYFLPIFLPTETPAFVDLGALTFEHGGETWQALQFTRDKDFGTIDVPVNTWLIGIAGDEWPPDTVDVKKEMLATRIVSFEIDGTVYDVNPSCFLDLSSDDGTFGLYNVWVRFTGPGVHTLRITVEQIRNFYFVYPYAYFGIPDPAGLDGRRVFVRGENVGDTLDDRIVHSYVLNVVP